MSLFTIPDCKAVVTIDSNVYAASFTNKTIYKNNTIYYNFGENMPYDMRDMVADGTILYIVAYSGYLITIDTSTTPDPTIVSIDSYATGLCIHNNLLYVTHDSNSVEIYSSSGDHLNTFVSDLDSPQKIIFFDNVFYILEKNQSIVKRWNVSGEVDYSNPIYLGGTGARYIYQYDSYFFVSIVDGNLSDGVYYYDLSGQSIGLYIIVSQPFGLSFYNDDNNLKFYVASDNNGLYTYENQVVCFDEKTNILCQKDEKEVYVNISDLNVGDLVKTYKHGFKKIKLIGSNTLINNPNIPTRSMYRYKHAVDHHNNLVVTGGHSILVDNLSDQENKRMSKYWNENHKIEDKFLLLSCCSDDFEQDTTDDKFKYYQIVLENEDKKTQYGVWGDGVLTETCCEEYFVNNYLSFKQIFR